MKAFKRIQESLSTRQIVRDDRGLSTVEYVIILMLIAIVAVSVWRTFGNAIVAKVTAATTGISTLN